MGLLVLSAVRITASCSSGTFARWQTRTLTWTPKVFQNRGGSLSSTKLIPLLFQPSSFVEQFATADFTLLSANLSLPCAAPDQFQSPWQLAILPEVWIQLIPTMVDTNHSQVGSLCQLFDNPDSVPGCQDWSRLEAWERIRIFYDIPKPINLTLNYSDYSSQCLRETNTQNRTWSINVTPLIETWLRYRDPWNRRNATIPLMIVAQQSYSLEYHSHQVDLRISFWMDGKLFMFLHVYSQISFKNEWKKMSPN